MTDFRPQQAKQLVQLLGHPPKGLRKNTAESFLLQYVFLEALLRLVGRYYRQRSTAQKKLANEDGSLNVVVVNRSLKHFGVRVDQQRIDGLLSSGKTKRGQKTARVLRNGLVHRWDAKDAGEVIQRFEELTTGMKAVVNAIAMRVKGAMP
jgi:hypothetical protein